MIHFDLSRSHPFCKQKIKTEAGFFQFSLFCAAIHPMMQHKDVWEHDPQKVNVFIIIIRKVEKMFERLNIEFESK